MDRVLCLFLPVLFILLVYYLFRCVSVLNFWRERDVTGPRPYPIFGNFASIAFGKESAGNYLKKIYDEYRDESMIGIFVYQRPYLLLKDLGLIRDVLVQSSGHFKDRGYTHNEKEGCFFSSYFSLDIEQWSKLRPQISAILSSRTLEKSFSFIREAAKHLDWNMHVSNSINHEINCEKISIMFTVLICNACSFRFKFMKLLEKIVSSFFFTTMITMEKALQGFVRRFLMAFPWVYDTFAYHSVSWCRHYTDFIKSVTAGEETKINGNGDFFNFLKNIQEDTTFQISSIRNILQLYSMCLISYYPSAITICHALYELALNRSIQDNLRKEIMLEFEKNDGVLEYSSVKNMEYIDMVVKETLRKYPPLMLLTRESSSNYTFPGTKVTIPKGQKIYIPIYAIHHDPNIYKNPDIFDPNRFKNKTYLGNQSMTYLPFGAGPRNCIGAQFADCQIKVGLITILRKFYVEISENTEIPYFSDPNSMFFKSKNNMHLQFIKIKKL